MKLCLAPNTCHCCLSSFPHPLLPTLHISLAAEIIQKECLALVEQMIGRARKGETEEEKKRNREGVFCGVVKAFWVCFSLEIIKRFWVLGLGCPGPFSSAHRKQGEKMPVKCKDLSLWAFCYCCHGCFEFACQHVILCKPDDELYEHTVNAHHGRVRVRGLEQQLCVVMHSSVRVYLQLCSDDIQQSPKYLLLGTF